MKELERKRKIFDVLYAIILLTSMLAAYTFNIELPDVFPYTQYFVSLMNKGNDLLSIILIVAAFLLPAVSMFLANFFSAGVFAFFSITTISPFPFGGPDTSLRLVYFTLNYVIAVYAFDTFLWMLSNYKLKRATLVSGILDCLKFVMMSVAATTVIIIIAVFTSSPLDFSILTHPYDPLFTVLAYFTILLTSKLMAYTTSGYFHIPKKAVMVNIVLALAFAFTSFIHPLMASLVPILYLVAVEVVDPRLVRMQKIVKTIQPAPTPESEDIEISW